MGDSNDHAKLQLEIHSATSLHARCIAIACGERRLAISGFIVDDI